MGDNINIDWRNLEPAPDISNSFMTAFNAGHQMAIQRQADTARNAVLADPSDQNALTKLSMFDPQSAQAIYTNQDRARAARTRDAASQVMSAYAMPDQQTNAFAPPQPAMAPQAAPQAAPQPLAAPQQPGMVAAPSGQPQAPQMAPQPGTTPAMGTQPGAQQQPSPMTDPTHPVTQAVGQAAMSGQINKQQAWAALYGENPEVGDQMVKAVQSIDGLRLSRLAEANNALGSEAQALLAVPQQGRAAELQRIAPQLLAHGVTAQQLQGAMQEGLSDNFLHGVVGQAIGTAGLLEETHKNASDSIADRNATNTENTQALAQKHENFEEQKGVQDGFGNIVNPTTGAVIYRAGDGAGNGTQFAPQAGAYAKALSGTGMSDNAVAGIMGNLHVESGFDPKRIGDNGLATGAAQWHPDRAAQFRAVMGVDPAQATPQQTAQFIQREISQLPANQRAAILNASSPGAAAAAFDQYFERSDGNTRTQRMASAQSWASDGGAGNSGGAGGMTADAIDHAAQLGIAKFGGAPPPGFARNKGAMAAISNRIADLMKTGGTSTNDAIAGSADIHASTASLATLQKQATLVNAAENAAQANGRLAQSLAPAVGNGNIPFFNAWKNSANRNLGDPNVVKLNGALETYVNEFATVMGRGTPTDSLRAHAHDMINGAQSPDQLNGVFQVMNQDMANRRAGLETERRATLNHIRLSNTGGGNGSPRVVQYDAKGNRVS